MNKPRVTTEIIQEDETHYYYVVFINGQEFARKRIPLHVVNMDDPEKIEFHLRQIAADLAKKFPKDYHEKAFIGAERD